MPQVNPQDDTSLQTHQQAKMLQSLGQNMVGLPSWS